MELLEIIGCIQLIAIVIGVVKIRGIYTTVEEIKEWSSEEHQPEREKPRPK